MGDIADAMLEGELCETCGVDLGDDVGYPRQCAGCKPREMSATKCERTITEKSWKGTRKRKCGRKATHRQLDGLPLCERHYNAWQRKMRR